MFIRMLIILFAITSIPAFAIVNGKAADHTKLSFFVQIMDVNIYVNDKDEFAVHAVHSCGGSILNKQYILTAAHCVDKDSDYITKYVSIGEPSRVKNSIKSLKEIEKIHIFEKYGYEKGSRKEKFLVQDLAILKLKNPISENVSSVNLPNEKYKYSHSNKNIVMGLGRIESSRPDKYLYGAISEYLRYTDIELFDDELCGMLGVHKSLLCSRDNFKKSGVIKKVSYGDSGSPIIVYNDKIKTYEQVGIVSSTNVNYNNSLSLSYYQNITTTDSKQFISQFENIVEKTRYNYLDKNYYLNAEHKDIESFKNSYNIKVNAFNKEIDRKREIYYASDQYKYDLVVLIFKVLIFIILILAFFTLFALIVKTIIDRDDLERKSF